MIVIILLLYSFYCIRKNTAGEVHWSGEPSDQYLHLAWHYLLSLLSSVLVNAASSRQN